MPEDNILGNDNSPLTHTHSTGDTVSENVRNGAYSTNRSQNSGAYTTGNSHSPTAGTENAQGNGSGTVRAHSYNTVADNPQSPTAGAANAQSSNTYADNAQESGSGTVRAHSNNTDSEAETDKTEAVSADEDSTAVKHGFRIQKPVVIAAVILLASVIFFGCWALFFNSSIHGSWVLGFRAAEKDCAVTFTFEKDGTCYFHNGGVVYKGCYTTNENSNGRNKLNMKYTSFGQPMIDADFYYEVGGNAFSGRTLTLTDLSGLVYKPGTAGDETDDNAASKEFTDIDGVRYYIYTLGSGSDGTKNVPIENASTDDKLTGIWLEINADSAYDNTFAFYEDGTYQITYRDLVYKGCYSAKDGECTFNITSADGSALNNSLKYSFRDEKLVITINDVPATLVPVESEYAFETGIK